MKNDICKHCGDYKEWCDCVSNCRKGDHWWVENSERCRVCNISKQQYINNNNN